MAKAKLPDDETMIDTPEMGSPFAMFVTVPEMTPEGLSAILVVVVVPAVTDIPDTVFVR